MRKTVHKLLPLAVAVLLTISGGCVRRPAGVQSDDKMVGVLADMELAEAYLQSHGDRSGTTDSLRASLIAGVLEAHGLTREEYDATMDWYGHNVDVYYKLDDKVSKELARRNRQFMKGDGKSEASVSLEGDLWPYGRMAMISDKSGEDNLSFSVPGASIQPGMSVKWRLRMHVPAEMRIQLGVEYQDGGTSFVSRIVSMDKRPEVELVTDTARKPVRVFGFIQTRNRMNLPLWMDSISLSTVPLDTTRYYRINSQRKLIPPRRKTGNKANDPENAMVSEENDAVNVMKDSTLKHMRKM